MEPSFVGTRRTDARDKAEGDDRDGHMSVVYWLDLGRVSTLFDFNIFYPILRI